ncbi:hypothetical protein N7530_009374 [Penicillium desertorum]|uniref:ribonuclease T2 n=1 Tax=Penicillium desertorum TaxID=1303715 RepID=A0A9W9WIC6_9EURO|nr:hypothetical protein N7530_009374 [Penicillium desertorum]
MFQSQSSKGMLALAAMSLITGSTASLETCESSTPLQLLQLLRRANLLLQLPRRCPPPDSILGYRSINWPDNCDGTYEASCDSKRAYSNITAILQDQNLGDLVDYMDEYWVDINGDNEDFWSHEWSKHGTCINTIEPSCYSDYKAQEEVGDYFQKTVELFKSLDTYKALDAAGITPSTSKTYSLSEIQEALTDMHGASVYLGCSSGELNQVWYFYNVKGNVVDGTYKAVETLTDSGCPKTGIKYLPK